MAEHRGLLPFNLDQSVKKGRNTIGISYMNRLQRNFYQGMICVYFIRLWLTESH